MAERAWRDRAGGASRRLRPRQRFLQRRAGDRVRRLAVRAPRRRDGRGVQPPHRSRPQALLRPLVRAQQRRAGHRGQRRQGRRARPGAVLLRRRPQAPDRRAPRRALRTDQAAHDPPPDLADLSAGRRRVSLPGRRQSGLPRVLHAAAGAEFGTRDAALARRLRRGARCGVGLVSVFPGGSTRYRGRGARAEREPLVDDDAARGDPARLCAPRRPAGTVRDDEAPSDRQSGVRPQFDRLARERLGDDDRAGRRTLDRAGTGVARGHHAGGRQPRRAPLPRSQSRDPGRADAVGEREPEPAARSGAERPGEAARTSRAPSRRCPPGGTR